MSKIQAWSWSRLDDFEKCPLSYYKKYVLKEFPKFDATPYHLTRGKVIHKVCEGYLKTGNLGLLKPETNKWLIYSGPDVGYQGKSMLKHPLDFIVPLMDIMRKHTSLDVEGEVAFDADLNKVSWFDSENKHCGKVWVRVIWDALCVSINGTLIIIDWKTGKIRTKGDQLRLFAGAGMAMHPEVERVLTAYIWLDHPTARPLLGEYTREYDFENIWQEFGDRAELIQLCVESGNWEAKPCSFNCTYCPALTTQCVHKKDYER